MTIQSLLKGIPHLTRHATTAHETEQNISDSRFIRCEEQPDPAVVEALGKIPAAEYPPALLAARRAAFKAQIRAYTDPDVVSGPSDVSEWQDERNSRPLPW